MPIPTSVDSNVTGLAFAEESALKTLSSPTWRALEPNSYSKFGANYPSVARDTINATRQKLRGTITDLESDCGFNIDMTPRNLMRLMQGFMFANMAEKPTTAPLNVTGVTLTANATDGYQAAAGLNVSPAAFLAKHLILARSFAVAQNNGLKEVSAVSATKVTITGSTLTTEVPPAAAHIQVVGYRAAAGDLRLSVTGVIPTMTSTTLDFTTLGLQVGEWIFIGGDAAINRWVSAATIVTSGLAANYGYARIGSIAAHAIVFDLTMFTPTTDADGGGLQRVDLYFGKCITNATVAANIIRRTYQFERTLGDDGSGTQSEYITGAVANEFTLNEATAAKLNADLSFVGLGYEVQTGTTGVKAGTRVAALGESAFNTSHDVYLSRLSIVDPTQLNPSSVFAYLSDLKLSINNGADPVKALGVLGGFNYTIADFAVSATATAYFQTIGAQTFIKNNQDCCLTNIISRFNFALVFDIPMLTLGGGENKVTKDKPITVDLTQDAAKNANNYTMMVQFMEYVPTIAMPA
jgi:hypothetical protein